jgi:molybdate-binding protein/DNA-binding XRE family transcriptional regulator
MEALSDKTRCNLKPVRKMKGLSQSRLAERVGVKRQAIYDMESGKYVPNTAVALRMAKELGCRVEDLFSLSDSDETRPVTLIGGADPGNSRVSLVRVRDRLIAYPLDAGWMPGEGFQASDGVLLPDGRNARVLQREEDLEKKILLLGCDPAFSILSAHASRWAAEARVQCRFASSRLALERLAEGCAHIAGSHLHNPSSIESNVALARTLLPGAGAIVVAFSFFEEGLMVVRGNPHGIRNVADLANPGVKFVNREAGAALRTLLDEFLAGAGVSAEDVAGYDRLVSSHGRGAQMVAYGLADAALGLRAVAEAYGLDFVSLQAVRCDLVIPCDFLDHPTVKVLMDVLQTRSLREELASLPGYESSCTGELIGRI